jgi:hypothetical protein
VDVGLSLQLFPHRHGVTDGNGIADQEDAREAGTSSTLAIAGLGAFLGAAFSWDQDDPEKRPRKATAETRRMYAGETGVFNLIKRSIPSLGA